VTARRPAFASNDALALSALDTDNVRIPSVFHPYRRRKTVACPLVAVLAIAACAPDTRGPGIDVDAALGHVAVLATSPRPGDSDRSRETARYIESQVPGIERLPVGTVGLPEITILGQTHRTAHAVVTTDPNLIVRFGPRSNSPALLVMAHYDTVATSPGAIDNAVAVGVLIELARVFAKEPPSHPVILAFTANEEIGLAGAEALVVPLTGVTVDLAIALDLNGGPGELVLNGASDLIGLAEMRWLAGAADRAGVVVGAPLAQRVVSRWWPQAERSDHGPFTRRGVRAFHLYNRGHDGERIDLAYHRPGDLPSRVVPASVDELGRLLRALTADPVPKHAGDGMWLPIATNTVVPRWWLVGFCIVLASGAIALLLTLRAGARGAGSLGLLVGIACFALATGATFGIEYLRAGDHPAPWMHAPLRWLVAELLVLGGLFGLATRFAARFAPWCGERRYLVLAAIPSLAIGSAWLVGGAAELAWIWLVPAALTALAPRLGRLGILAIASLVLPIALVLGPEQIREAAWNGFMSPTLPFVAWISILSFPLFAGIGWYLRARGRSGPLGTFALSLGCLLAMIVGLGLLIPGEPACTAAQFHEFHLACEVTPRVP
jgi:Peptidase family M28